MDVLVHIGNIAMQRVAVTHHTGRTPESGHYTATVATPDGGIYDCNDCIISRKPESSQQLWHNSYLSFLHNGEARDERQPADSNPAEVNQSNPAEDACEEGDDGSEQNDTIDDVNDPENTMDVAECNVQAIECHATSTRHDDWLHRGAFLADLPWYAYMMRVQRTRKPTEPTADHSEYFFFDKHYALSALYCQQLRYASRTTISRLVG